MQIITRSNQMILRRNVALGYRKGVDDARPAWADTQLNLIEPIEEEFVDKNPLTDQGWRRCIKRIAGNLRKIGYADFAALLLPHIETPAGRRPLHRLLLLIERAQHLLSKHMLNGVASPAIYAYSDLHIASYELQRRIDAAAPAAAH